MAQLDDNEFQWILVRTRRDRKMTRMLRATHIGEQLFCWIEIESWEWKVKSTRVGGCPGDTNKSEKARSSFLQMIYPLAAM